MTSAIEQQLRERARALLAEGGVDLFLGYRQGSNLLRVAPHIARTPAEAERLVWNVACVNNLAGTLQKHAGRRVGIVLKGCDALTVAELLRLNQLRRERLHIVGVVCRGVVDPRKIEGLCAQTQITAIAEDGAELVIHANGAAIRRPRAELLYEKCRACTTPVPELYDELLDDGPLTMDDDPSSIAHRPGAPDARRAAVEALDALDAPGRLAYWSEQLSKCTLCYACQTMCPLCFCKECSLTLERNDPKRKSCAPETVFAFHVMRAYHMAGRCTGCDECERVCPVDIPLSTICSKIVPPE